VTGLALVHGVHGEATGFVGGFLKKSVVHEGVEKRVQLTRASGGASYLPQPVPYASGGFAA
jgi:hypothetical protein